MASRVEAGRCVRVLLVEDEPKLAFAIRTLLETEGRATVLDVVGDARRAAEAALALRPDVVLLDVRLDAGDGIEAAVEMRGVWPEVNVVVYSGEEDELERARRQGFSQTLLKGAISDQLLAAVHGRPDQTP
jgi:DNA-binding NarL/FixJ family response regulator